MTTKQKRAPRVGQINRSRVKILEAAFDLLLEKGIANFTIDGVIERTGIARTTIYRHWPTRDRLLYDALAALAEPVEIPDTGTLRGDLVNYFQKRSAHFGTSDVGLQDIPGLMDAARTNPELQKLGHQSAARGMTAITEIVERAKGRGEVEPDLDSHKVGLLLLGAIIIHRGFLDKPLTQEFIEGLIDTLLAGIR